MDKMSRNEREKEERMVGKGRRRQERREGK